MWIALLVAIGLPVLGVAAIAAIAFAPDDYTGRILVVFEDQTDDTDAYMRLAGSDARPLRVITAIDGWIAESETPGTVAALRDTYGARFVFRDVGLGRAMAGCLGLASGPARPHGIIP